MIFDKIEILYEKFCLPVKIKYSETRKPTFMEFLILSIILEYPNRNKSIRKILNEDFKILNVELFERALKDLINFKIIELKKTQAGWSTLGIDLAIDKIEINELLKEQFIKKEFVISQMDKNLDVNWIYDPVMEGYELSREQEWNKRLNGVKLSHKLNFVKPGDKFYSEKDITNNASNFVNAKPEYFGDNAMLTRVELNKEIGLEDLNLAKQLTNTKPCANEAFLEFFENDTFKLRTDNIFLENYFRKNPNVSKDIAIDVANKYSEKIKERFVPKRNFNSLDKFQKEPDLISNINVRSSWNLLLINGQDITSTNKMLKNKDLISNVKIIIFYNSKSNDKTIEVVDDKIVAYLESSGHEILRDNSLIYLDSENNATGFSIVDKHIPTINQFIPVVYAYKNKGKVRIEELFEDNLVRLFENYENELFEGRLQTSTIMLNLLKRIGLEQKLYQVLYDYLAREIDDQSSFEKLNDFLVESDNLEGSVFLEKCLKDVLINASQTRDSEAMMLLLEKYKFKSTSTLFEMLNNIKLDNDINFIFRINSLLDERKIDGWKVNVRNCLVKVLEYAKDNLRSELLSLDKYRSTVWKEHAATINKIGNITKELYNKNFEVVEKNYQDMLISVIDLIKSNNEIQDYKNYLWYLSETLVDFYSNYYEYKINEMQNSDSNLVEYKIQLVAGNAINKIEEKLDSIIDVKARKLPIELKLEWAKHVENKRDLVNEIIKKDDSLLYLALNLVFGKKDDFNAENLQRYQDKLGGL